MIAIAPIELDWGLETVSESFLGVVRAMINSRIQKRSDGHNGEQEHVPARSLEIIRKYRLLSLPRALKLLPTALMPEGVREEK